MPSASTICDVPGLESCSENSNAPGHQRSDEIDSSDLNERERRRYRSTNEPELSDFESQDDVAKRKRRRQRGLDKKFECSHEGCHMSYTRAEHLYRHQLNHNPKQLFNCDFPDCYRSFVRQDLCVRHKERHTARGSQLLRKENFMQDLNPIVTTAMQAKQAVLGKDTDVHAGNHEHSQFCSYLLCHP
jgi:uncharacterized Zn-finger protein